jgi:hypothetical protein
VFRLGDRLSVKFKGELRMAGPADVAIEILVARHAGIRANVKTSQVAHAGGDADGVSPILSGVPA